MGQRRWKRTLPRMHNGRPVRLNNTGYVLVWEPKHPKAFRGWYWEHRIVAAKTLGREILSSEDVHHINGIKCDNRPENLRVMDHLEHKKLTVKEQKEKRAAEKAELAEYRRLYGPLHTHQAN